MKNSAIISFLCVCLSLQLSSQQNLWTLQNNKTKNAKEILPPVTDYDLYQLDLDVLKTTLSKTGDIVEWRSSESQSIEDQLTIDLPIPGNGLQQFSLFESSIMAPALQAKYPGIKTYTGRSIMNPQQTVKLDVGPNGFHAMIFANGISYLIEPAFEKNQLDYVAFKKQDLIRDADHRFNCMVGGKEVVSTKNNSMTAVNPTGAELRTYRLALGTTGEYSSFHGGTKELVLASMVTTMNRINGIYERDFTITFELVANTDILIYLDSNADPYTNDDLGDMLDENQEICDELIGFDNYDIGHVFGTSGGGLAGLGVVCGGVKAWGATGLNSPD